MITTLPPEMNVAILDFLSDKDVLNLSSISKTCNALIKEHERDVLSSLAYKIIKQNKKIQQFPAILRSSKVYIKNKEDFFNKLNTYNYINYKHKDIKNMENKSGYSVIEIIALEEFKALLLEKEASWDKVVGFTLNLGLHTLVFDFMLILTHAVPNHSNFMRIGAQIVGSAFNIATLASLVFMSIEKKRNLSMPTYFPVTSDV